MTETEKAHDQWFREQVAKGLEEADSPGVHWVSHCDVERERAAWRESLRAQIEASPNK